MGLRVDTAKKHAFLAGIVVAPPVLQLGRELAQLVDFLSLVRRNRLESVAGLAGGRSGRAVPQNHGQRCGAKATAKPPSQISCRHRRRPP